jgi:hypothetical protein
MNPASDHQWPDGCGPVPPRVDPTPSPRDNLSQTQRTGRHAGARPCSTMRKRLRRCCSVCLSGSAIVAGGPLHARPRSALAAAPGGTRDHRRAGSSPSGCSPPCAAADSAAHEQRSRVDFSSPATVLQRQGRPTYREPSTVAQRAHRIGQQPVTHAAPEPQPLDQPPASTGDEATSNTSTITDTRMRRWATCPGRVRARSRPTTNSWRCEIN